MKPKKKKGTSSTGETSLLYVGLLIADAKAYFDDWFGKILADNHVHEDQIMGRIEVMAKEAEEGREDIKEEVRASEARIMYKLTTLKGEIEHIRSSKFVFNIDLIVYIVSTDPLAVDLP